MAATNVAILDDAHLTATVPAGTGVVDVRVQSGVTIAANPRNYKGTIYGYGISSTSAASKFTYSTAPAATAGFVGVDAATGGTWKGAYGADGVDIQADANAPPSYAAVAPVAAQTWTWDAGNLGAQALQRAAAPGRVAATWYDPSAFSLDLNLTDGRAHKVSLYVLDYDAISRSERIDVLDAASGAVLDSRSVSGFAGGEYLSWKLSGHVVLRVTNLGGKNAVASALFFDPTS